jgi:hypothetical protein
MYQKYQSDRRSRSFLHHLQRKNPKDMHHNFLAQLGLERYPLYKKYNSERLDWEHTDQQDKESTWMRPLKL